MPTIEFGVFVAFVLLGFLGFLLMNRFRIFMLLSTLIFAGLALFMIAGYDVVMSSDTTIAEDLNTTDDVDEKVITGYRNNTVVLIDSSQPALGYIFLSLSIIMMIVFFGKAFLNW